jgi:hypothetical protein
MVYAAAIHGFEVPVSRSYGSGLVTLAEVVTVIACLALAAVFTRGLWAPFPIGQVIVCTDNPKAC